MPLFASYRDFIRLERKVDALLTSAGISLHNQEFIIHQENIEMATLADIQAQADASLAAVTKNTDALASIKTVLDNQNAQIATLTDELNAAIANGADPTALQAISDKLTAVVEATDTQAAAEAALANTPAAPPTT